VEARGAGVGCGRGVQVGGVGCGWGVQVRGAGAAGLNTKARVWGGVWEVKTAAAGYTHTSQAVSYVAS